MRTHTHTDRQHVYVCFLRLGIEERSKLFPKTAFIERASQVISFVFFLNATEGTKPGVWQGSALISPFPRNMLPSSPRDGFSVTISTHSYVLYYPLHTPICSLLPSCLLPDSLVPSFPRCQFFCYRLLSLTDSLLLSLVTWLRASYPPTHPTTQPLPQKTAAPAGVCVTSPHTQKNPSSLQSKHHQSVNSVCALQRCDLCVLYHNKANLTLQ